MICPRCKAPHALTPNTYEGVATDQCKKCQGIWLDEGELVEVLNTEIEKFSESLIKEAIQKTFTGITPNEEASIELCPKCHSPMQAVNYSYSSGIIIDRCPSGHGVWLDHLEIEKAQAHKEHWAEAAQKNKSEWVKMLSKTEDQRQATADALDKQKLVRAHYLVSSIFKRLTGSRS